MRDTKAMKRYMFMCSDAFDVKTAGVKNSKDFYHIYFSQGLPWPVKDRYAISSIAFMLDTTLDGVLIKGRHQDITFTPPVRNAVQMPVVIVSWRLEPVGANKSKITYQALADPVGLPTSVANFMLRFAALDTIKAIRELVKEEPYRSAKSIVTTTPYHEEGR